jgi:TnsA-like endonuclease N terminal
MKDYICLTCKKQFKHRKIDKKYCSHTCYSNRYPPIVKTCETCAKEFTVAHRFHKQRACSFECAKSLISKTLKTSKVLICEFCSNDFVATLGWIKSGARFCSKECFHKHLRNGAEEILKLTCEYCKVSFEKHYTKRNTRFCSYSCANTGINNGMFGKPGPMQGKQSVMKGKTKETDVRLALMGKSVSNVLKKKFASGELSHAGEKNTMWGHTPNMSSDESKLRYSKAAIKRVLDGKSCTFTNHKSGKYVSFKTGIEMFYRSSWELIVMKWLDKSENVVSYNHEPFTIQYDEVRHYLPDFLITFSDGKKLLIEVKPEEFLQYEAVIKKMNAGIAYALKNEMTYEIWTKEKIMQMKNEINEAI